MRLRGLIARATQANVGRPFAIAEYDPAYTAGMEKDEALQAIQPLRERVNELQNLLYADRRYSLLVVLQAIDTGGKDSTINSVFAEAGPLGCRVVNYGVPSSEELAHDYLWRYHRDVLRRVAFVRVAQRVGLRLEDIKAALDLLPERRTPHLDDWERLAGRWRDDLDERIRLLEGLRDQLTSCIGCGCLSLKACRLYNPEDAAATLGPGPRYLLGDAAADVIGRAAGR